MPCFFLLKVYNPRIRANSLVLQPISQSQAETRKQLLGSSPSGSVVGTVASSGKFFRDGCHSSTEAIPLVFLQENFSVCTLKNLPPKT